ISQQLLWRGADGYEAARRASAWRANTPPRFPAAILLAEQPQDIAAAVKLARARSLRVTVRSGGHGWSASHLRDDVLLIDVSRLDGIVIAGGGERAAVDPGAKGWNLNRQLRDLGRMFPAGHHRSVGLGGYLLNGGWGWNARQFGVACANVTAIDLIDANGEPLHADEDHNADFLWAARGAGSGFFGVVTRFELRTFPLPPCIRFSSYAYSLDELEEVLRWAIEVSARVPRNLEFIIGSYGHDGTGKRATPRVFVNATAFAQSEQEATQLLRLLDECPCADRAERRRVAATVSMEERLEMTSRADPDGMRYAADNIYTDATAEELVPYMRALFSSLPSAHSHIFWWNWGPLQPLPDMALSIQGNIYLACYSVWEDAAEDESMERWVVDQMKRVEHLAVGSKLNDENMARRPARYFSDAARERLEALRRRYDPDGVFASFPR
ncbi:MAG: FAD-binding oxidoreductase, partial [Steroidobacteraceae bacterium]